MARECSPIVLEGSAPGLEIKQRIGCAAPSEGGESAHSVALSNLSDMRLEGVPIAQKVADKKFNYLDATGKLIAKEDAMKIADGVVYYQDNADPSKGRLRHRGSFVSTNDARSIVSSSKVSNASDVANLHDLEEFDVLPAVNEDDEETEHQKKEGKSWFALCLRLIVIALFVYTASTTSMQFPLGLEGGSDGVRLLEHLSPAPSQALEKQKEVSCSSGEAECNKSLKSQSISEWMGSSKGLSTSLAELVAKDEMPVEDRGMTEVFLDGTLQAMRSICAQIKALFL